MQRYSLQGALPMDSAVGSAPPEPVIAFRQFHDRPAVWETYHCVVVAGTTVMQWDLFDVDGVPVTCVLR